jgi:ligand-binding SRPBCC domain-containing protein
MVSGAFKSFRHEHHFLWVDGDTETKDVFVFESPFGILGRLFDWVLSEKYMTNLLAGRNRVIKEAAETKH